MARRPPKSNAEIIADYIVRGEATLREYEGTDEYADRKRMFEFGLASIKARFNYSDNLHLAVVEAVRKANA